MKTFEVREIVRRGKVGVSLGLSSTHIHNLHSEPLEKDGKPVDDLEIGESGKNYIKGEYTIVRTI